MYEHDYDGSLAKTGKRHLGKTRWTREEVHTDTCPKKQKQQNYLIVCTYQTIHFVLATITPLLQ